jgi:PleD family two-component response regulator
MRVTPRVRSVLLARGTEDAVRSAALLTGMRTMFADGERKVARGVTVLDEVTRVVPPDEAPESRGEAGAGHVQPVEEAEPRRPRILLVDDDSVFRSAVRDTLAQEQYEVVEATRGDEALAQLYREPPNLVLTDLHMPGLDGLGLLKRMRGDLSTRQIPVVFLTVDDSVGTEVQALDLGADDFVTKPVESSVLLSRVRRALLRAHLMQHAG